MNKITIPNSEIKCTKVFYHGFTCSPTNVGSATLTTQKPFVHFNLRIGIIISILFFFFIFVNSAKSLENPEDVNKLNYIIGKYIETNPINGVIYITKEDQPIFKKAYGYGDANKAPLYENIMFGISSTTKLYTASLILKLSEENKLSLNDPITKFFPQLPDWYKKVTIHNLLTHTSGIDDLLKNIDLNTNHDHQFFIDIIKEQNKPVYKISEEFLYDNLNYIILGIIIEKASGMTYEEYFNSKIKTPFQLFNTYTPDSKGNFGDLALKRLAKPIFIDQSGLVSEIKLPLFSNFFATSDVIASAAEVSTFMNKLFSGYIINSANVEKISTSFAKDKNGTSYGYGVRILEDSNKKIVFHGGFSYGFTVASFDPQTKFAVIILTNNKALSSNITNFAVELTTNLMNGKINYQDDTIVPEKK